VNHTSEGKTVTLLQTTELGPRHLTGSASPRLLASPDLSRSLPEFLEAVVVSNDPVIPVVASQFLHELLVLFRDRSVQIFRHHSDSAANARLGRLLAVFRLTTHAPCWDRPQWHRDGRSSAEILTVMKERGLTITEAIKASMQRFGIWLGDAESLVSSHPSWNQTAEAAKPFQDDLIQAFRDASRAEMHPE
jgi:hypothetical protein